MVLDHVEPRPLESDSATAYTAVTPPDIVAEDFLDYEDPLGDVTAGPSSVLWPGSTFIIRSVSSGRVVSLLDGQVVLASPGGRGSIHWDCVETKGWLGLRNSVSGKFLGHDQGGTLCCSAPRHKGWENFCVRIRPEGGYLLLMTHFERLWPVATKLEHGVERLAKTDRGITAGNVWEFIKI